MTDPVSDDMRDLAAVLIASSSDPDRSLAAAMAFHMSALRRDRPDLADADVLASTEAFMRAITARLVELAASPRRTTRPN